jgi:hypothetical protein
MIFAAPDSSAAEIKYSAQSIRRALDKINSSIIESTHGISYCFNPPKQFEKYIELQKSHIQSSKEEIERLQQRIQS